MGPVGQTVAVRGRCIGGLLALLIAWAGCGPSVAESPAAPQPVRLTSADGTTLQAWVFRPEAGVVRGWVVALHGCGGLYASAGARQGQINARHQAMAELLVAEGYAVLFPDSLTSRGETELCTQPMGQRRVTQTQRQADALAALAWAAGQPGAEGGRLALLGWSHGGSAVLAATDAGRAEVAAAAVQPRLAVAFYPGCSAALRADYRPAAPLVLLLGERDDWTPPAPCIELGRRVGAEVHVFPDSHHDFDNPVGRVRLRTDVPNGLRPGQGVHTGPNPQARQQAYALLRQRLAAAMVR